ncbi:MAG: glycosyltransferase family 39 protein [Planctomycetaceae bacterium]
MIYFFFFLQSPYAVLQLTDQAYYRNWGIAISHGDLLGTHAFEQGPFYAYLLGLFYSIGLSDKVIIVIQMLLGATLAPLIYSSALKLQLKPAVAIIAGLLTACYGPLVYHEAMIMKSWLSPLCTTLALWATLNFLSTQKLRWLALTGISTGIVCLSRENHLLMLFPVVVFLYLNRVQYAPIPLWKAVSLPVVCTALIHTAGHDQKLHRAHEFVLVTSGGGEVLYMAHGPFAQANYNPPPFIRPNPYYEHEDFRKEAARRNNQQMTRSESSKYWSSEAVAQIKSDPLRAMQLTFWKGFNLINNYEVPDNQNFLVTQTFIPLLYLLPRFAWLLGFALLGLVMVRDQLKLHLLPIGLILVHVVTILIFYNFDRFRIGLTPILAIYAGLGLFTLYSGWRSKDFAHLSKRGLIYASLLVATGSVISLLPPHGVSLSGALDTEVLSENLQEMSQMGAYRAEAERLVANHPDDVAGWVMLAKAQYTLSQFEEANLAADKGLKISAAHPELLEVKADALTGLRRTEEAISMLNELISKHPDYLSAYVRLAVLQREDYETVAAINTLDLALEREPRNASLWFNKGNIAALHCFNSSLYGEDQHEQMCEEAEQAFEKALQLDPQNGQIQLKVTDYYLRTGDTEKTLNTLTTGMKTHPELDDYQGVLLEVLRQQGTSYTAEQQQQLASACNVYLTTMLKGPMQGLTREFLQEILQICQEHKITTLATELQQFQGNMAD